MDDSAPFHFLIVDDDEDIRDLFTIMVERLGHSADAVRDGVEAVEALAVQRYDYMLLDLTMPRMTGEAVMSWLKQHPEWAAGVKVVVVTALAGNHHERLTDLGAHAVLSKPLGAQQLRDLIDGPRPVELGRGPGARPPQSR